MNMKKIYIYPTFLILLFLLGCNEDFLDKQPYDQITSGTFYKNRQDIEQAVVAIYDVLQRDSWNAPNLISESMSDNCSGGGGIVDGFGQNQFDQFYNIEEDLADPNWQNGYLGVYRANLVIENIKNVQWSSAESGLEAQYTAEARFLRAYFYFNLAKIFGHIPLVTKVLSPEEAYIPQAKPEDVYRYIAEDLIYAIENLPRTKPGPGPTSGRATKWAAEGLLARVWLFYTGYYKKSDIAGIVSKSQVTAYLDDIIINGGFDLLPDFSDLWELDPSTNNYNKDNIETIFAIKYTNLGHGDWNISDGNRWQVMVGPRNRTYVPFAKGWGQFPVNPSIYLAYDPMDTRRDATIVNWEEYLGPAVYDISDQRQYTGFGWNKYCARAKSENQTVAESYGGSFMIDNFQDLTILRYADILLMAAELHLGDGKDVEYFNKVRDRAYQDETHRKTSLTIQDIMEERRLEFALEGLRYHDLLRQGLDVAKAAIDANSFQTDEFPVSFPSDKGFDGFIKIPGTQVTLSNGTIKQSQYWESPASASATH
jgi:starch-binding outer membrane protein, SusD/RagB family